jgi:hypothetical protein
MRRNAMQRGRMLDDRRIPPHEIVRSAGSRCYTERGSVLTCGCTFMLNPKTS